MAHAWYYFEFCAGNSLCGVLAGLPAANGTSGSSTPCITSVGTLIVLSRLTREPSLRIASICRPIPCG